MTMNAKGKSIRKSIGKRVIHKSKLPDTYDHKTGWTYSEESRDVILMAVSGSWAMVRRPRCVPYCAPLREIEHHAKG